MTICRNSDVLFRKLCEINNFDYIVYIDYIVGVSIIQFLGYFSAVGAVKICVY